MKRKSVDVCAEPAQGGRCIDVTNSGLSEDSQQVSRRFCIHSGLLMPCIHVCHACRPLCPGCPALCGGCCCAAVAPQGLPAQALQVRSQHDMMSACKAWTPHGRSMATWTQHGHISILAWQLILRGPRLWRLCYGLSVGLGNGYGMVLVYRRLTDHSILGRHCSVFVTVQMGVA